MLTCGLASMILFTSCKKNPSHPTKDLLRSFIQKNYPDLLEVDNFNVSKVEFYKVGLGKKTYTGARVKFQGSCPEGYTTFVLGNKPNLDLIQSIKQFERNQKQWGYRTYELDLISDSTGKSCLILIQDK